MNESIELLRRVRHVIDGIRIVVGQVEILVLQVKSFSHDLLAADANIFERCWACVAVASVLPHVDLALASERCACGPRTLQEVRKNALDVVDVVRRRGEVQCQGYVSEVSLEPCD